MAIGVVGVGNGSTAVGVYGKSDHTAGLFDGDVTVNGDLEVSGTISKGGGSFRIEPPGPEINVGDILIKRLEEMRKRQSLFPEGSVPD